MKRLRSYLVSIFVVVLLLSGLFHFMPQAVAEEKAAASESKATVPVKSVKLSKTSITIKKGSTAQLKVTVEPKNASNKEVTWKSSDSKIANVNKSGKVTAVMEGKATITVTSVDGKKTAKCAVTVSKKDKPSTNKTIIQISAGEYHSLALFSDGTLYAWGNNDWGKLGDGTFIYYRKTPTQITFPD